jgi:hypothetical protein
VASPADIANYSGKAWTYWIVTPDQVGCTGNPVGGFDYPELSVSQNYLYMSWDAEGGPCTDFGGRGMMIARTSLAGLHAGGQIHLDYTDPTDGNGAFTRGGHLMQNPNTTIYWAGHNGNNKLRVFFWPEGQNYSWVELGISTWADIPPSLASMTPDGNNWLGSCGTAIIGATQSKNGQVWFAWTAGPDSNFPQAHIEMVTLDTVTGLSKSNQVQIWNSDYAFAYPALATNLCTGEVGLSFEYGGNGNYQNHVVGFWGDFVAYITTVSAVGTTRFGDYVTIHPAPPTAANPGNLFSAFGYGLNKVPSPGTGKMPDVHYVQFGRPASSCVPVPH